MLNFCDLHVHSTFSVLDGHPDPEEIAAKAASLGRTAHALTDHGSVSGHVLFEKEARARSIKPVFGVEAYASSDALARGEEYRKKHHLTLLAKTASGYKNLMALVTRSYDEGFYYRPTIDGRMLMEQGEGMMVLSGCESGHFMRAIDREDWAAARSIAKNCQAAFGDDYYIEIQHFPHMVGKNAAAFAIAEELGIKQVLTCDSHYLEEDGWKYQQLLWAIRDRRPVEEFRIEHAYLWEPDKLYAFVQEQIPSINWQRIFENTCEVAAKAEPYFLPRAPHVRFPLEGDKIAYIRQRCLARLAQLGIEGPEYLARLDRELALIAQKQYEDYFLVVDDMVNWAKKQGILVGPARGSSAASLVCYGLRITEIDPLKYDLLFERFIDVTRVDLPDIDVDFEDEHRAEVFAYMADKYGKDNVAFISTFARLGGKSVLDDAARSYRIPLNEVDVIKRHLVQRSSDDQRGDLTLEDTLEEFEEARDVFARYPQLQIAAGVQGKIRHLGRHAAGLIVTSEPIREYVAVYRASDEETQRLIAVDWRDAMLLNLMKIDLLGLKELTIVRMVASKVGMSLEDIYAIPLDDAATIAGFNAHDLLGVFQYEGLATKSVATQVVFEGITQVADVSALARPGPLHSGSTGAYIAGRRSGTFVPILPQADVQTIINQTYGQIVYQEQIMRILRDIGGLTWEDVYSIRSIIGKSKGSESVDRYWPKWEAGTQARGVSATDARQIWECLRLYGKHCFNKSHAVAYGIVSYWSMYMKVHYPAEFYWAQLIKCKDDAQTVRFIRDAIRRGIAFHPVSLRDSAATWTIDANGIRPGWSAMLGIGPKAATELQDHMPYRSYNDMCERVNRRIVNKSVREAIALSVGRTVDQLYGISVSDALLGTVKDRVTAEEFNDMDSPWPENGAWRIAGRVIKLNKKNRIEEYRDKGKDASRIDVTQPQDYMLLNVEDETDTVSVYINTEQYQKWHDAIWACKDKFVSVQGARIRMEGSRPLFAAKEFKLLKEQAT